MAEWNAGWPVAVTGLLVVVLAAVLLIRRRGAMAGPGRKQKTAGPAEAADTVMAWAPTATRVLTKSERDAYHVLRRALPEHMILAQVPLARFLKVPTRNSYTEWLRRVGSLCADLVVCDANANVLAVVELRQPVTQEKPRTLRRRERMDRVLKAAGIPVHVWLEGVLPGPAVARETVLGSALAAPKRPAGMTSETRRSMEAAAVVASMQTGGGMQGMSVNEQALDFDVDEFDDDAAADRKGEPPPSTWFDDLDSEPLPLEPASTH